MHMSVCMRIEYTKYIFTKYTNNSPHNINWLPNYHSKPLILENHISHTHICCFCIYYIYIYIRCSRHCKSNINQWRRTDTNWKKWHFPLFQTYGFNQCAAETHTKQTMLSKGYPLFLNKSNYYTFNTNRHVCHIVCNVISTSYNVISYLQVLTTLPVMWWITQMLLPVSKL